MKRRVVLYALFALVAGISVVTGPARTAQTWPDKPITFIVPFAAGGGTDAFARPLAAQLDTQLGKRVLIENRAGAGGRWAHPPRPRPPPTDTPSSWARRITPSHRRSIPNLDYNFEKDFIAVALIARPPQVIVVNPEKVAAENAEFAVGV